MWLSRFSKWFAVILLSVMSWAVEAQELNAKVTVNSERLGTVDQSQFSDLESQLMDMINQTQWTNMTFSPMERIDCSFAINLLTMNDQGEYTAELCVSAQRPVYNASYVTPLLLHRDKELNFTYNAYDPITYDETRLESNLIATVVFYVYYVIMVDLDSFGSLGGNLLKDRLSAIANTAQQKMDWQGWQPFASDRNRYALAEAFNAQESEQFRTLWYDYHHNGLDEMAGNARRGVSNILKALPSLETYWKSRPSSPFLRLFADTKIDELTKLMSESSADKKKEIYKLLFKVYPADEQKYISLKRNK